MARRAFLRRAGTGVAAAGLLAAAACHKDHKVIPDNGLDIGAGDIGLFNLAYVVEQVQAAFFQQVVATPYINIPSLELSAYTYMRDHDTLHREFFKSVLGSNALPVLTMNFSSIDFTDRTSVLITAKNFKNASVKAYDGSAYLIQSPDYLVTAAKVVSVEARHCASISDFVTPATFTGSDVIRNGLNGTNDVGGSLLFFNTYLKVPVNAVSFAYSVDQS